MSTSANEGLYLQQGAFTLTSTVWFTVQNWSKPVTWDERKRCDGWFWFRSPRQRDKLFRYSFNNISQDDIIRRLLPRVCGRHQDPAANILTTLSSDNSNWSQKATLHREARWETVNSAVMEKYTLLTSQNDFCIRNRLLKMVTEPARITNN